MADYKLRPVLDLDKKVDKFYIKIRKCAQKSKIVDKLNNNTSNGFHNIDGIIAYFEKKGDTFTHLGLKYSCDDGKTQKDFLIKLFYLSKGGTHDFIKEVLDSRNYTNADTVIDENVNTFLTELNKINGLVSSVPKISFCFDWNNLKNLSEEDIKDSHYSIWATRNPTYLWQKSLQIHISYK